MGVKPHSPRYTLACRIPPTAKSLRGLFPTHVDAFPHAVHEIAHEIVDSVENAGPTFV